MNAIDPTPSNPTVQPQPVPALNFADLRPGDPFPWVRQRTESMPSFAIDAVGGRYLVFCFYGTTAVPAGKAAIEAAVRNRELFNDARMMFFGVCVDPQDEAESRVPVDLPGMRFLWDFDRTACRACGAIPTEAPPNGGPMPFRQFWLIVDPSLHVLARIPFENEPVDHAGVFAILRGLPPPGNFAGFEIPAPVLVLPNVFDPDLCRRLIVNELPIPALLNTSGKKPWELNFLDTMDLWKFGDYKSYISLNLLAHVLNVPTSKDDIDGSMVGDTYWNLNDLPRIVQYCQKDVITLTQIYLRMNREPLALPENIEIK